MSKSLWRPGDTALLAGFLTVALLGGGVSAEDTYLSPQALAASPDGRVLYVAEADARQVAVWDIKRGAVEKTIAMPAEPTGLALSSDGDRLVVTCAAPQGTVCVVDPATATIVQQIDAGYGATAPVLDPAGSVLYVCNQFDNDVSVIELTAGRETKRIAVAREPVAAAVTPDGSRLFVANLLPAGRADADFCAATVSVIDTAKGAVVADIGLPNGSTGVQGVCVSPDGAYAFVTHAISRFHMPTTQLDRGWMNTSALTLIDVARLERINSVLLDDVDLGTANPWAVVCAQDGRSVYVTSAGTHELHVIDVPGLLEKLANVPAEPTQDGPVLYPPVATSPEEVPNDLAFLVGLRRRIRLEGNGPRALAIVGRHAYAAMYFSGTLDKIDLDSKARKPVTSLSLGAEPPMTPARKGEMYFHDAVYCFQHWQSCSSCHPDARVDALNWDLLNDGMGNPKNAKSMLLAHQTPPAMSTGIRDGAEEGVRAGVKFILFTVQPESHAEAIDAYLKQLTPMPSPRLVDGALSPAAQRGKDLFFRDDVGCATCHPAPLYTDLRTYDVGTRGPLDRRDDFDTPALVEGWRTAPYLHDGRAVTLVDILTKDNAGDKHGVTSHLSKQEIQDLAAFALSL